MLLPFKYNSSLTSAIPLILGKRYLRSSFLLNVKFSEGHRALYRICKKDWSSADNSTLAIVNESMIMTFIHDFLPHVDEDFWKYCFWRLRVTLLVILLDILCSVFQAELKRFEHLIIPSIVSSQTARLSNKFSAKRWYLYSSFTWNHPLLRLCSKFLINYECSYGKFLLAQGYSRFKTTFCSEQKQSMSSWPRLKMTWRRFRPQRAW